MDEPMSNIDAPSRIAIREEILKLHKELGTTTVYVTHNMADAMAMAKTIAVINEGTILQTDIPQAMYNHPRGNFIGDFIPS